MSLQPEAEEDSGDEFARQIEAELLEDLSDDGMQDTAPDVKTEQKLADEAWAAFDAAVAEDPNCIPKPKPRMVEDKLKMPQSTTRKRDIVDDLAALTTSRAKFVIDLDVSFDMSNAPKYLQSQQMHYYLHGRDATTIENFFSTLWLENHEWLIHYGYSLGRVQQVKRLEITLLIKEGRELRNTHSWSIKGDFSGREQCEQWKDFLAAAERWGKGEALDQLRIEETENRIKRRRFVKDWVGNMYDQTGTPVKEQKRLVHAHVDANIVLHFE